MKIKRITILEVEYIAFKLAKHFLEWDEPIPAFGTRFVGRLESCIAQPFQSFNHKLLYRGIVSKSAILFYLMVKNHPFENGNKRIAVTTLLYFLEENGLWLKTSSESIYHFAKEVAKSDPREKEKIVESITTFINAYKIKKPKE